MSDSELDESLTGDPMTDALVPLVEQLADAVFAGDAATIEGLRVHAEQIVAGYGRPAIDAAWGLAVIAAGMLPGGAPPRLLLAWRHLPDHLARAEPASPSPAP
ncbi:hypothetical protein ACFQE5_04770 [Pseudonocardia hispaniensis]|uniref:Uncharacterized protein n=1 Tax=Pseudonocardia hispaniensis TaxID=904933 RepID=A0ABW1IYC8_9PSEU